MTDCCEVARAPALIAGICEHPGGDRWLYLEGPEGNVLEVWDFFESGDGAEEGVDALA